MKTIALLATAALIAGCASSPAPSDRDMLNMAGGANKPMPSITTFSTAEMVNFRRVIPGLCSFYAKDGRDIVLAADCVERRGRTSLVAHELYNLAHNGADDCAAYVFAANISADRRDFRSYRAEMGAAKDKGCPRPVGGWGILTQGPEWRPAVADLFPRLP